MTALEECWLRFSAYTAAVADAGPSPDAERTFVLLELELATDRWRDRLLAALDRHGIPLDDILSTAPGTRVA